MLWVAELGSVFSYSLFLITFVICMKSKQYHVEFVYEILPSLAIMSKNNNCTKTATTEAFVTVSKHKKRLKIGD